MKLEIFLDKKKIIFLDRDGIINRKAKKGEYIKAWKDFIFIKKNLLGLRKLSKAGYKFIIISNQAGVARKIITKKNLSIMNYKMKKYLKKLRINILSTYYCCHHWNDNCSCRKPNPGLFYKASKDWNFNLEKTIYIGDDIRDCIASYNANCKSVFIGRDKELNSLRKKHRPIYVANNIDKISNKLIKYLK